MNASAAAGSRCLKLAYLDRMEATDAKRDVLRYYGIVSMPVYCESHRCYHLRCETWPPVRKWRDILLLIARGFRRREIARTLGISPKAVSYAIYQMSKDWHALSQAHLVAIVTSFGVIEPDEFLFLDTEVARFRPRDNRKATYTDAV